jgi:hypothetical protein
MNRMMGFLKYDRKRFADAADYLAIALVASLPWSTSLTGILVVTWLIVLLPALDWPALRREVATAAGGLPVLLVVLAALGILWADVAWNDRAAGFISYVKLLVIPFLFVQFRRSGRGRYAIYALLTACTALLVASYLSIYGYIPAKQFGVVVKDYISQSGFFVICLFVLTDLATTAWREGRRVSAFACVLLGAAFLANIVYVTTGRTALLVIPVLLILFGLRRSWKVALVAVLVGVILAGLAWLSSPYLRDRLDESLAMRTRVGLEGTLTEPSSTALRLAFWRSSSHIVAEAPIIGHGTGSIRAMFQRYGAANPQSLVEHATNPHNQILAVAIQLGILGTLVLLAMWLAHALMFRGSGLASWFGCVVVVQNVVGSLANSHLFDFVQGWTYAICVGIAGGMALARGDGSKAPPAYAVAGQPKARYEHASAIPAEQRTP